MQQIPIYRNFNAAVFVAHEYLRVYGELVKNDRWQGMNTTNGEKQAMWELLDLSFQVENIKEDIAVLAREIEPNLPWADEHFLERVGGDPLNPGNTYQIWPFYPKSTQMDKTLRPDGKFSHTYMERYWPKEAGMNDSSGGQNHGVRFPYGDLLDVIRLLIKDNCTRQAYLPVWFPEDTGSIHNGRVPCTLGYWFIRREGRLHVTYYIRSCDAIRHFRDDIYLTCRLLLWIMEQLRDRDYANWKNIKPGNFTMHIGSFHIFADERKLLK